MPNLERDGTLIRCSRTWHATAVRSPVSLFDIVVDRAAISGADVAERSLSNEIAAQPIQLYEPGLYRFSPPFRVAAGVAFPRARPARPRGSLPWSWLLRNAAHARTKLSILVAWNRRRSVGLAHQRIQTCSPTKTVPLLELRGAGPQRPGPSPHQPRRCCGHRRHHLDSVLSGVNAVRPPGSFGNILSRKNPLGQSHAGPCRMPHCDIRSWTEQQIEQLKDFVSKGVSVASALRLLRKRTGAS